MLGTSHQKVPPKKKSHNKHEKLQKKWPFKSKGKNGPNNLNPTLPSPKLTARPW